MSAELLREAAAEMRLRVKNVRTDAATWLTTTPDVLLAQADWLEAEADEIPPGATHYREGLLSDAPAVRLAAAYLNQEATR